jgi:hypothetical protein
MAHHPDGGHDSVTVIDSKQVFEEANAIPNVA